VVEKIRSFLLLCIGVINNFRCIKVTELRVRIIEISKGQGKLIFNLRYSNQFTLTPLMGFTVSIEAVKLDPEIAFEKAFDFASKKAKEANFYMRTKR
jgi:hypothetical protein